MRKITEADIVNLQELYGITLTPEEVALINTQSGLLGSIERQQAFLLGMALIAIPCPACGLVTCQRAAALTDDWLDAADNQYACHACDTPLIWVLPITGQAFFAVNFEKLRLQHEIAARRAAARAAAAEPPCPTCSGRGGFPETGESCSDCMSTGIDPASRKA